MTRTLPLGLAVAALLSQIALAQAPAPLASGVWRNPQPADDAVVQVRIDRTSQPTRAHLWMQCGHAECDWGEEALMPAARNDAAAGASGIWRQGTIARYVTIKPSGDGLEVTVRVSPNASTPAHTVTLVRAGAAPSTVSSLQPGLQPGFQPAPPSGNVLRVGGTIPEPQKIRHVPAVYPPDAAAAGIQGIVIVEVVIGKQGAVEETRVLRSRAGLDNAAVTAIKQWEYTPTLVNGEAVRVAWTVTLNFVLPPRDPAATPASGLPAVPATPAVSAPSPAPVPDAPPEQPPAPVRVGGTIQPPTKIMHVNPVYPVKAQANRIQGVVILELIIGTDGYVENSRIVRGVPELNDAATDAVTRWVFTPTLVDGVAQRVIYTVSVSFSLQTGGGRGAPPSGIPPGTRAFRIGNGIAPPQRIKGGDPKYPSDAKSKKIEGTVVLELTILPDGRVSAARVVKSIKELDKAAVEAAMKWEFTPTLVNGARVTALYEIDVPFKIER